MEAKLRIFILGVMENNIQVDIRVMAGYFLENSFEAARKLLKEGQSLSFLKAVDYEELVKGINGKFLEAAEALPTPRETEEKVLNKKQNINFLKVIKEKVGDVAISEAIKKL